MSKAFINLVGTQGTGKTTILKLMESEMNFNIITEVVRKLNKTGVNINESGNDEGQQIIFNTYVDTFNNIDKELNWVSDRGLIDVVSYTKYLYDHGNVSKQVYEEQLAFLNDWYKTHKVIICYFPIEFDVVNDGVRSLNEEFRKEVDNNIRWILKELQIDHYIIEGSVHDRLELMKAIVEF